MAKSCEAGRGRISKTRTPAAMMTITAIGITALSVTVTPPITALALPATPLGPPACQQWGFAGPTDIDIVTGRQVSFSATGAHVDTAATVGGGGAASGQLAGDVDQNGHVNLRLTAFAADAENLLDTFDGEVGANGTASGTVTFRQNGADKGSSGWSTAAPLKCVTEAAPKNAVAVDVEQSPFGVSVTAKNNSALDGRCTYDARPTNNPLLPPVHRDFHLNPHDSTKLDFLAPPVGATYHLVIACHGTVNGQDDEFGHHDQDVTGGL